MRLLYKSMHLEDLSLTELHAYLELCIRAEKSMAFEATYDGTINKRWQRVKLEIEKINKETYRRIINESN